jgi:hypothetical protein
MEQIEIDVKKEIRKAEILTDCQNDVVLDYYDDIDWTIDDEFFY